MIKRTLLSASVAALTLGSVAPAFAAETTSLSLAPLTIRRMIEFRNDRSLAAASPSQERLAAVDPVDGRTLLSRPIANKNLRFFNRTGLGWLRGGDYRVLDRNGDMRRYGLQVTAPLASMPSSKTVAERFFSRNGDLPPALVLTGDVSDDQTGNWGWLRPTRRTYIRVNRDRDLLQEIEEGGR